MKTVAVFSEKDGELDRRITEFQSNVAAAVDQLERDAVVEPQIVQARKTGTIARVGQLVIVDGSVLFELLLAKPRPDDEGRTLVVVKKSSASTLTLRAINSAINSAATAALTNEGRYELQVAGGQYWVAT